MSLETWVSIGSLITVLIAIFAVTARQSRDLRSELKGEIDGLRTELKGDIAELRSELKGDIARLDERISAMDVRLDERISAMDIRLTSRIETLDSRVYALAVGLRPHLDVAEEAEASP